MDNKYCDCGDPFQIHDSNDPKCSKVRGVFRSHSTSQTDLSIGPTSDLLSYTRKVSNSASSMSSVMSVLGFLTIIGGFVIAFQSSSIDLGNGYGVTSHPYVLLGFILSFGGLLQILVFRLIFNYIQMQARFREWQLAKSS